LVTETSPGRDKYLCENIRTMNRHQPCRWLGASRVSHRKNWWRHRNGVKNRFYKFPLS
jgi:hypothetical protein